METACALEGELLHMDDDDVQSCACMRGPG